MGAGEGIKTVQEDLTGEHNYYLTQGYTSPTINLNVNGKILRAVVDTGSGFTLIKEATVTKLGSEINKRRNLPNLQGVTGSPLRILGMVLLEVGVGNHHVHKQWCPVVPNNYIDADVLLGMDILARAPFHWNGKANIIYWGDVPYTINRIRRQKGRVERVQAIPNPLDQVNASRNINLTKVIRIEPYQSQFIPIHVPRENFISASST